MGLPVSQDDVSEMMSVSALQRVRGLVNTGVYEIAPDKVHFGNPAWQVWLHDVAGPVALRALRADAVPHKFPDDPERPSAHARGLGQRPQRLRHILRSWKQDVSGDAPQFLACLLQNNYPKPTVFDATSLTGDDELLMTHLRRLASELKFQLYLAHIVVTVKSSDDEEELNITQIVDLSGMPVNVQGLELGVSDLLNAGFAAQTPDSTSSHIAEACHAPFLEKTYKRTVLLLWPRFKSDLTVSVGNIYEFACDTLGVSDSFRPTRQEKKLVDNFIHWCWTEHRDAKLMGALNLLRETAYRWNDVDILLRAMEACGVERRIDLMGVEDIVTACQAFGWAPLSGFLAMFYDASNTRRWHLLTQLKQLAAGENDPAVGHWCQFHEEPMLRALYMVKPSDIPWLIYLGMTHGGAFLEHVIYPQLEAQRLCDMNFWVPFFLMLFHYKASIPSAHTLIQKGVGDVVTRLPAFPIMKVNDERLPYTHLVLGVINLCLRTDQAALCPSILPWRYYIEISHMLENYILANPAWISWPGDTQPFFADTVVVLLSPSGRLENGKRVFPCGPSFLNGILHPDMVQDRDSGSFQDLIHSIVAELKPTTDDRVAYAAYQATLCFFVNAAVDAFPLQHAGPSEILGIVEFCFQAGATSTASERLLVRVASTPDGATVQRHISTILTDPFKAFAVTVVKLFAKKIAAPKPQDLRSLVSIPLLREIGCGRQRCDACADLRGFIRSTQTLVQFSRVQGVRKHMESQLKLAKELGFTLQTLKDRNPHTLVVTKSAETIAYDIWNENQQTGKRLLALLGDVTAQGAALGSDYDSVVASIDGVGGRPPLANLNQGRTGQKRGQGMDGENAVKKARLS
ncbi:hypothetical protein B0H10DRAFT_2216084 [Mycena sp. CBHHK59/15]|nr:hypothetical protein B0H10DRAFT_2216084 [Mycena sp. CBHHK59/15]